MKGIYLIVSVVTAFLFSNAFGMNFKGLNEKSFTTKTLTTTFQTTITLTNGDTLTKLTETEIKTIINAMNTKNPFEIREQIYYPEEIVAFNFKRNINKMNKDIRPNRPNFI